MLCTTAAAWALALAPAAAHDFRIGDIIIDHPYAVPSPAGSNTGAAYLRTLKNSGDVPDRLLGARTPAAASVEIHRSAMDGNVMRMRAVDAVDLPARTEQRMRHGGEWHLMLIGLKAPLKEGDRFALTLRFERAGEKQVSVSVQQPRDTTAVHRH